MKKIIRETQHNHVIDRGKLEAAKVVKLLKNIVIKNVELLSMRVVISSGSTTVSIIFVDLIVSSWVFW